MTSGSRRTETVVGVCILMMLVVTAAGVLWRQSSFDEKLFTASLPDLSSTGGLSDGVTEPSPFQSFIPDTLTPLTPPETFGADNLSDKIDGEAELYLSAGFRELRSQRFKRKDREDLWLEVFIYQMSSTDGAFSVFSTQRPVSVSPLDLTRFSYQTENAVFFVHGSEYLEIIGGSPLLLDDMVVIGANYVRQKPLEVEKRSDQDLFPAENLDPASISLHSADVFGFSRLNNVFTAKYTIDGQELRAFISRRESAEDAREMAAAYHQFLLEHGGVDITRLAVDIPGVRMVEIFDLYELIFDHDNFFAGVHEADNKQAAEKLAGLLFQSLQRVAQ